MEAECDEIEEINKIRAELYAKTGGTMAGLSRFLQEVEKKRAEEMTGDEEDEDPILAELDQIRQEIYEEAGGTFEAYVNYYVEKDRERVAALKAAIAAGEPVTTPLPLGPDMELARAAEAFFAAQERAEQRQAAIAAGEPVTTPLPVEPDMELARAEEALQVAHERAKQRQAEHWRSITAPARTPDNTTTLRKPATKKPAARAARRKTPAAT